MNRPVSFIMLLVMLVFIAACEKDEIPDDGFIADNTEGPKPYYLPIPLGFPEYDLEEEHLLTEEGVKLGRRLFYDPILSKNSNVSCASCHKQENAFSDPRGLSIGTHGGATQFHSMPLFNIGWMDQFFWDGRAPTREAQALKPVTNPIEMGMTWDEAIDRLENDRQYPTLFAEAFGTDKIDSNMVASALVQFEMTIVSANSKFDLAEAGLVEYTPLEAEGKRLFNSNTGGDCFHCHSTANVQIADNSFHNNGLDSDEDLQPGLAAVTGRDLDYGKFKTPSLRNLVFTAPYMHDGRFQTLEEVIDFYSSGVQHNRTISPLMEFSQQGGVGLNDDQKEALIAFLLTMTDSSLLENKALSNPFEG